MLRRRARRSSCSPPDFECRMCESVCSSIQMTTISHRRPSRCYKTWVLVANHAVRLDRLTVEIECEHGHCITATRMTQMERRCGATHWPFHPFRARELRFDARFLCFADRFLRFEPRVCRLEGRLLHLDLRELRFDPRELRFHPRVRRFDPRVLRFHPRELRFHPRELRFDPLVLRFDPRMLRFHARVVRV